MGKGGSKAPKIEYPDLLTPEQKQLLATLTGALQGSMFEPIYAQPPQQPQPQQGSPSSSYAAFYAKLKKSMPFLSEAELQKRAQMMADMTAQQMGQSPPASTAPSAQPQILGYRLKGEEPYPGTVTPPATSMQERAFNLFSDMLNRPADYIYTGKDVYNKYAGFIPLSTSAGIDAFGRMASYAQSIPQLGARGYRYLQRTAPTISPTKEGMKATSLLNQLYPTSAPFQQGISAYEQLTGKAPSVSRTGQNVFNEVFSQTPSISKTGQDIASQAIEKGYVPYEKGLSTLEDLLTPYNPASAKEMWRQSVVNPALTIWKKDILPTLKEPFVAAGAYDSGARRRAEEESGRRLAEDLAGKLSELVYTGQQAHLGRQAQILPQALTYAQLPISQLERAMGIGSTELGGRSSIARLINSLGQTELGGLQSTARLMGELGQLGLGERRAERESIARIGGQEAEQKLRNLISAYNIGQGIAGSGRADVQTMANIGNMLGLENWRNIQGLMGLGQTNLADVMSIGKAGLSTGGIQRGIQGELLQEPYQKWLYSRPYNNPYLPLLQTALGIRAQQPTVMPGQARQPGFLENLLTGASPALGWGLASNLFPSTAAGAGISAGLGALGSGLDLSAGLFDGGMGVFSPGATISGLFGLPSF